MKMFGSVVISCYNPEMYKAIQEVCKKYLLVVQEIVDPNRLASIKGDLLIIESKLFDKKVHYNFLKVVVVLSSTDHIEDYIDYCSNFLFGYKKKMEIQNALYQTHLPIVVYNPTQAELLQDAPTFTVNIGKTFLDFSKNSFVHNKEAIYLTPAEQKYLIERYIHKMKNTKKRYIISRLRKKYGTDFLREEKE